MIYSNCWLTDRQTDWLTYRASTRDASPSRVRTKQSAQPCQWGEWGGRHLTLFTIGNYPVLAFNEYFLWWRSWLLSIRKITLCSFTSAKLDISCVRSLPPNTTWQQMTEIHENKKQSFSTFFPSSQLHFLHFLWKGLQFLLWTILWWWWAR